MMHPEEKRHKSHSKGLFILAERGVETDQWLLSAELEQPTKVNVNIDAASKREEKGSDLYFHVCE